MVVLGLLVPCSSTLSERGNTVADVDAPDLVGNVGY